jgi:type II secretory pathway component GspD/PulD (secretin)
LISKNTRENNAAVEKMIQTLDTPNKQILIEARFIQISVDDLHELGVDFILDSPTTVTSTATGQPKTQLDLGNILSSAAFPNAGEGLNLNYRGVLTNPMFKAVLHALEKSKKATSISNPRITTVNNRAANIFVGEIFQYFSNYTPQSVQSGVSPTGVPLYTTQVLPTGSPTIVPLGITLDVTPSVGSTSENITLVLSPSISQFDHFEDFQTFGTGSGGTSGTTVAGGSGGTSGSVSTTTATANNVATIRLPIFTQSSVSSKAIVRSGETVVLGGLIKENISKEQSAPPILGKIPLIGRLFRHTNNANTRSNLLIFVTASLLSTEGRSVVPSPSTKP